MTFEGALDPKSINTTDNPQTSSHAGRKGSGGRTKWVVAKKTNGLMEAQLLAGYLQSEGIPAWSWQEGAGVALGLNVGILGTGHVMVPEQMEDQALELLNSAEIVDTDFDDMNFEDLNETKQD